MEADFDVYDIRLPAKGLRHGVDSHVEYHDYDCNRCSESLHNLLRYTMGLLGHSQDRR